MNKQRIWAIVGGGNGGQTFAGHLAMQGERVRLYSKSEETVRAISKTNEITLRHAVEGVGRLEFATTDLGRALRGADNIVVILPSLWHEATAEAMMPHLVDGQNVLLLPEASCGALAFRQYMERARCAANIVLGAGGTLPYTTRLIKPGEAYVFQVKNTVEIAALPASDNEKLFSAFSISAPVFKLAESTLHTSIDNINAMMHGAPSLLNVARIEAVPGQQYEYYREGITPTISKVLEQMDRERIAVANAFGITQRTLKQEYIDMYSCGSVEDSLIDLLRNCPAYVGLYAQTTLETRYILEDIPFSLVPISALGQIAGVPTPAIDTIISLGKIMMGDKMCVGRTAEHLGIQGYTLDELKSVFISQKTDVHTGESTKDSDE